MTLGSDYKTHYNGFHLSCLVSLSQSQKIGPEGHFVCVRDYLGLFALGDFFSLLYCVGSFVADIYVVIPLICDGCTGSSLLQTASIRK
jgi:hypothetical protein